MINLDVFTEWIVVLSERFKQPLSLATQSIYYDRLSQRLSTEQFVASAEALFDSKADRLPGVEEWATLARTLVPDPALPAAPEPPLISELPPEERDQALAAKERALQIAKAAIADSPYRSDVFSSIAAVSQIVVEEVA